MSELAILKNNKYYPLENLANTDIVCAFSTRLLGNMSLCYGDTGESLQNRKNFLSGLGINYQDLVCAQQIHASSVRYIKEEDRGKGSLSYSNSIPGTDALVTDKRNLPLAIFTADCLSLFLFDSVTCAIGLIHAGWKSTKENITARVIQLMQKQFNTKTSSLYIGIGAAIRNCCYEVSKNFCNSFSDGLIERGNRYYLDLFWINKKQALDSGVKEENIFDPKICTFCHNGEFFSYRKEGNNCGRMMSVLMLK